MKTYKLRNTRSCSWIAGLVMLAGAISAAADDGADPQDWQFAGEVYLWGASIGGDTTAGGEIDIPFYKLFDNLDFAIMGVFGARKDSGGSRRT